MKILIVTARNPYAHLGGDTLRISRIAEFLSESASVDIVCLDQSPSIRPHKNSINIIVKKQKLWEKVWGMVVSLLQREPLQVGWYRSDNLRHFLLEKSADYSCAIIHLIRMASYIDVLRTKKKIIELTDAISMNHLSYRKSFPRNLKQVVMAFDGERLRRYEAQKVSCFDVAVVVSTRDLQFLDSSLETKKITVIGNGVDIYPKSNVNNLCKYILFIGNLRSDQNYYGLLDFADEYIDLLNKYKIKIKVVGPCPNERMGKILKNPVFEYCGVLDNLISAREKCCAGIAPIKHGAGVQNKVLEYMSLGLPVIATSLVAEGFSGSSLSILVYNNYIELEDCLRSIGEDCSDITNDNRRILHQNFSWWSQLSKYNQIVLSE